MDCKQCREMLDCHMDGELSADAAAAFDVHLAECGACARSADRLRALRRQIRRTVKAAAPPPELEARLRGTLWPSWRDRVASAAAARIPIWVPVAAGVGAMVVGMAAGSIEPVRAGLSASLDRAALALARPETVELEGILRCRDCDLRKEHGEQTQCDRLGHRGSLLAADGRLWNIVEQTSSEALVRDASLLGRRVQVRARIFRDSGSLVVESYRIVG